MLNTIYRGWLVNNYVCNPVYYLGYSHDLVPNKFYVKDFYRLSIIPLLSDAFRKDDKKENKALCYGQKLRHTWTKI